MSVLIPGMEMPTNCCQCPVNMEVCKRGFEYLLEHPELYDKRADDCPLVPVPEHGRLIDADAVTSAAMEDILQWEDAGCDRDDYRAFLDNYIEDAPTIIPADPADEEGE